MKGRGRMEGEDRGGTGGRRGGRKVKKLEEFREGGDERRGKETSGGSERGGIGTRERMGGRGDDGERKSEGWRWERANGMQREKKKRGLREKSTISKQDRKEVMEKADGLRRKRRSVRARVCICLYYEYTYMYF